MTRWVEGAISILVCGECRHITPYLTFSADTDMVTMDLASLSSIATNEIVVVERRSNEFDDKGDTRLEARVNMLLGRDDLRVVQLLRSDVVELPSGLSFQEFRKRYRPTRLIYTCPKCSHGEATAVRSMSPSAYQKEGGKLTATPTLKVRD